MRNLGYGNTDLQWMIQISFVTSIVCFELLAVFFVWIFLALQLQRTLFYPGFHSFMENYLELI